MKIFGFSFPRNCVCRNSWAAWLPHTAPARQDWPLCSLPRSKSHSMGQIKHFGQHFRFTELEHSRLLIRTKFDILTFSALQVAAVAGQTKPATTGCDAAGAVRGPQQATAGALNHHHSPPYCIICLLLFFTSLVTSGQKFA